MLRLFLFVISAVLGNPAMAGPVDDVTAQVLKCLTMPADAPASYQFVLRLQITDGTVKMARVDLPGNRAPSEWEMAAMKALADAATDCEPYGNISSIFNLTPIVNIPVDEKLVNQIAK